MSECARLKERGWGRGASRWVLISAFEMVPEIFLSLYYM